MDRDEARAILKEHVARYRAKSYADLLHLLEDQDVFEAPGASGTRYQLEFQAAWDGRKGGNLRVIGAIDGGGIRACLPLCDGFILAPDGTFVGE